MLIQLCDMGTLHNLSEPRLPHVEKDNNTPSMVKVKWVTAGSWSKMGSYMFEKKKHLMKTHEEVRQLISLGSLIPNLFKT